MEPNQDVLSPVPTDEASVDQGVAQPEADESQGSESGGKEYNFRALEAERDKYRRESEDYQAQVKKSDDMVSMYKAMGYQSQQSPGYQPQQQQQNQSFGGISFDDAVDSESFNKLTGYIGQQAEQITQQTKMQSEQMEQMELKMLDQNWRTTIDKYLPGAIREDPSIADTIKHSPQAWKSAYHFATRNMDYLKDKMATNQSKEAERMVKNADKPKTLGSTGVQSNVGTQKDAFRMSAEEFANVKKSIKDGTYKG